MLVTREPAALPRPAHGLCLALGMFDGVHLGHQHVLRHALVHAANGAGASVALTFDPHPMAVVRPAQAPRLLQTLPQRLRALEALGLSATLVIPFDAAVAAQTGEEFIRGLLRDTGRIRSLSVGEGFQFGCRRTGDVQLLQALGEELRFQVHAASPVSVGGDVVSSSRIRQCIRDGVLESASELLGRPYAVSGKVIPGNRLGHTLGFPTANLDVSGLELPPHGVYAVWVQRITRNQEYPAVLNLGTRPTIAADPGELRFEVHLLDFEDDLYGEELEVTFANRLRGERRFPDSKALRTQIAEDIASARKLLDTPGPDFGSRPPGPSGDRG
ncbi:MAG: bifunctional riboflavin kinase/FAD synthetase [Verrucomicrobiales bacterium]|nr:bifunctional riboflavin kinase/FAD synthetase [Verrucomicrobiales bacterium]